jgi:hypothetical protein
MLKVKFFILVCAFFSSVLMITNCQQSKLNGLEPVREQTYPPIVSSISDNKTSLTVSGTNLDTASSVIIIDSNGSSQTLSISSKSSTSVIVVPNTTYQFNLNAIYSLVVRNAYAETTVSFSVNATNIAAGSFSVGTSYLVVTSSGAVGVGTATPTTGAALDISGSGATASSIIIPRDTTANRPSGVNGMIRYNTTTNKFEVFENSAWATLHEVKCASQQLTYSYLSGTAYYQCIAMMPEASAGSNSVASVDDDGVLTRGTGCILGGASGSSTGTLVTLGSSPSICYNTCTLTANCNSGGQWTNLSASSP